MQGGSSATGGRLRPERRRRQHHRHRRRGGVSSTEPGEPRADSPATSTRAPPSTSTATDVGLARVPGLRSRVDQRAGRRQSAAPLQRRGVPSPGDLGLAVGAAAVPGPRRHVRPSGPSNEPYLALYLERLVHRAVDLTRPPCRSAPSSTTSRSSTGRTRSTLTFSPASLDLPARPALSRCGPLVTPNLYTPPGDALTVCDTAAGPHHLLGDGEHGDRHARRDRQRGLRLHQEQRAHALRRQEGRRPRPVAGSRRSRVICS